MSQGEGGFVDGQIKGPFDGLEDFLILRLFGLKDLLSRRFGGFLFIESDATFLSLCDREKWLFLGAWMWGRGEGGVGVRSTEGV